MGRAGQGFGVLNHLNHDYERGITVSACNIHASLSERAHRKCDLLQNRSAAATVALRIFMGLRASRRWG